MAKTLDIDQRIVDAALSLAAETPWSRVSLADIAKRAKVPLSELYALYPSRSAILAAFARRIDSEVLSAKPDGGGEPRDRLFDVMMRRFDALTVRKPAIKSIARSCIGDPITVLCHGRHVVRSMAWMIEAAGIPSVRIAGAVRAHALAAIYARTLRVWLADDGADMAKTMAALDRNLRRAEFLFAPTRGGAAPAGSAAAS
ncbi:MAG: TetR family transcriptional regulator [Rhodospirillaceae bacterium]|nr:TetR family transcriptional regulator [Rhodospirillaceae bacterium]